MMYMTKPNITRRELIDYCQGFYLSTHLEDDWEDLDEELLYWTLERNAYQHYTDCSGERIWEHIVNQAKSMNTFFGLGITDWTFTFSED
jgi:hypothetical protein